MSDHDDDAMSPRTPEQVAQRLLALTATVSRTYSAADSPELAWVKQHGVEAFFSDEERAFYQQPEPTEQQLVNFSWRTEGLVAVAWALGGLDQLPALNLTADLKSIRLLAQAMKDPKAFIAQAQLRPASDIEAAEGELYQQHWRVRDAQLFNKPMPDELHPGVVYERRYALSWLVGYGDDWDEVPTDT